jgi:REP element-mobilizing transposase RayT
MGRQPRLHLPGAIYHVIVRGNSREAIFFSQGDRSRFLSLLELGLDRCSHTLHAYCLMTNHAHLVVQVGRTPIGALAHTLCSRYSRWSNRLRQRSGHLFERRYRATVVDDPEQFLTLVRYVHLNPVRANLVTSPGRFRWSSHAAYVGRRCDLPVTTELTHSLLGAEAGCARRAYRELLLHDETEPLRERFAVSSRLAEASWRRGCERALAAPPAGTVPGGMTLDEVVDVVSRRAGCSRLDLEGLSRCASVATARALAASVVRMAPGLSLRELGKLLRRDPSTLSEASTRYLASVRHDADRQKALADVLEDLRLRSDSLRCRWATVE